MQTENLVARSRDERGSAASRRLRRAGELPANLLGLDKNATALAVPERQFLNIYRSGAQLVALSLEGGEVEALVREVQLDTFGDRILHVDFEEIKRGQTVEVDVPISFFGDPVGAEEGGVFQVKMDSLPVVCMPREIPETLELDVRKMAVDDEVRVRDLTLPEGVTLQEGVDEDSVVAVVLPQEMGAEEEEEEAVDATEPERLGGTADEEDQD